MTLNLTMNNLLLYVKMNGRYRIRCTYEIFNQNGSSLKIYQNYFEHNKAITKYLYYYTL